MKLIFTTTLIILTAFFSCAQSNLLDQNKKDAVDKIFKKWDNSDTPGAAVGIIQNGKMLYARGYGLANLEHNVPNSPQTAFSISSNSKQFTAACIMILVQRGKLDLNQSLSSLYPDFPEYAKTISIKNLIHHTSGLRDYAQLTYLSGLRPNDYYNDDDVMKWTKGQKQLNFNPGEKYLYSNTGYWLLGQIVEKVSGMTLDDFAKKEIFEPLGMSNTHFHDNNNMIIKNKAMGYSQMRSGEFINFLSLEESVGDAGIYSTVEDIKKWDVEFYNQTILNSTFWKLMTTQGVLNNGEIIEYAAALEIKNYKGLKTIDHGGRGPGYWSDIIRFPEQKFTVIVFTNRGDAPATPLGYQIADLFLKDKFIEPVEKTKTERTLQFITLSNTNLKKYEGSYWSSEERDSRKIFLKNDTLMYARSPRSIHPLAPMANGEFKVLNTPPFIKAFVSFKKADKNYKLTIAINDDEDIPYEIYTPKVYSKKDLESFLGKYYSEELDTHYEFRMEEDHLRLYINGRKTVQLRQLRDEFFSSPMCEFEFKKKDQNIEGVTVTTPRVKNLLFKRVK